MSMKPFRTGYAILGILLLAAIITAGCTSPSPGPTPVPTQPIQPPTPVTTVRTTTVATTVGTTQTTAQVTQTTLAPPPPVAITVQNFAFSPASVSVPAGTTVTWTNQDAATHQIASDTGAFMGNPIGQGSSYSFTFTTPGTFPYHCAIHPSMKGTITVT